MKASSSVLPLRARLLARVPSPWKAPVLGLLVGRPWAYLLVVTLSGVTASPFIVRQAPNQAVILFWLLGTVLPFLVIKGLVSGDRMLTRWTLLFQRAVRPTTHYARVIAAGYVVVVTLLLLAWCVFAASGAMAGVAPRFIGGMLAGAMLWTTTLYCVGVGLSALVRRNDSELLVIILIVSYAQVAVARALGAPSWVPQVSAWLLLPVDGLYQLRQWFISGRYEVAPASLAQVLLYPAVWLLIAIWALHRLERLDLSAIVAE